MCCTQKIWQGSSLILTNGWYLSISKVCEVTRMLKLATCIYILFLMDDIFGTAGCRKKQVISAYSLI